MPLCSQRINRGRGRDGTIKDEIFAGGGVGIAIRGAGIGFVVLVILFKLDSLDCQRRSSIRNLSANHIITIGR